MAIRYDVPEVLRLLGPIERDHASDLAAGSTALFAADAILRGPQQSHDRIARYFDCDLGPEGEDCSGMATMRRLAEEVDPHLPSACVISAPHTHWKPDDFIVDQFCADGDHHHVGPSLTLPTEIVWPLVPISFVFDSEGPVAYEWADQTALDPDGDLERLWNALDQFGHRLLPEIADVPYPIGLSTRHRFKGLWESLGQATIERPVGEVESFAIVRRKADDPSPAEESIQVGWSLFSKADLTTDQLRLIALVEELAAGAGPLSVDETLALVASSLRQGLEHATST
jgi:hypothetical protein